MEELEIQIDVLKAEIQGLENSVDDFSRYGRSPNEKDYLDMIRLLDVWSQKRQQLLALNEVLGAIKSNKKCPVFCAINWTNKKLK